MNFDQRRCHQSSVSLIHAPEPFQPERQAGQMVSTALKAAQVYPVARCLPGGLLNLKRNDMGKIRNLTDQQIGPFKVIRLAEIQTGNSARWVCQCKHCGGETTMSSRRLRFDIERIKSCGCLRNMKSVLAVKNVLVESGAVPMNRPAVYRKKKELTAQEIGLREAKLVGGGRFNF